MTQQLFKKMISMQGEEKAETLHLSGKAQVPTTFTDRSSMSTVKITINDDLIS